MSAARQAHASRYTWEATARGTLEVLAAASIARRGRRHADEVHRHRAQLPAHRDQRPHDPGRPVAARLVLLAVVVALPDGGGAVARGLRARLRVPHAPPLRPLPLPVDARASTARAHVLVPKFGVPTLAEEVRNLGFDEVMELPHAQVVQLAPGVRVASYQNGPDDSVFVVADGEHVLVDINDGKIRGRTLATHPRRVRAPDVRVQELLVRAGLPGALHRRRSGRPRARSPATPTWTTGCTWSTSSGPATACRSAAWSRSCIPRAAGSTSSSWRPARWSTRSGSSARLVHRGGADGPGRQLELRDRLRARRGRLVHRPGEAPRGARGAGGGQDRDADRGSNRG